MQVYIKFAIPKGSTEEKNAVLDKIEEYLAWLNLKGDISKVEVETDQKGKRKGGKAGGV